MRFWDWLRPKKHRITKKMREARALKEKEMKKVRAQEWQTRKIKAETELAEAQLDLAKIRDEMLEYEPLEEENDEEDDIDIDQPEKVFKEMVKNAMDATHSGSTSKDRQPSQRPPNIK